MAPVGKIIQSILTELIWDKKFLKIFKICTAVGIQVPTTK